MHDISSLNFAPPQEAMIREISSWEGVTIHPHRFGGVEFRVGRRELGHMHQTFADLPFTRAIRDELIATGRAYRHHYVPDSGWVSAPMETPTEVANVTALFRQNYERAMCAGRETPVHMKAPSFH